MGEYAERPNNPLFSKVSFMKFDMSLLFIGFIMVGVVFIVGMFTAIGDHEFGGTLISAGLYSIIPNAAYRLLR